MVEFLADYGLFLAKLMTVAVIVLVVVGFIVATAKRGAQQDGLDVENLIKRYIVLRDAESIQTELEGKMAREELDEISEIAESYLRENKGSLDLKEVRRRATVVAETNMISKTLRKTNWNRWKAAKELKVSYKTLLTKIDKYDIQPAS